jgi:hypothetical protein
MTIDLNTCKTGDILISKHGEKLTYVKKLKEEDYYDHEIMYSNGSLGTRINDGHVYRRVSSRLFEDHDIVEIIHI